ncbi:MAG: tetratricopeptide repeat protein, partial [Verrucomicrobiota bacterium]
MALIHSNETSRLAIPALLLAEIRELYESGRSFTAYQKAAAAGPLARWTGVKACLLAGRLANNIGAPQLARKLHLRAWRLAPRHPEVVYFHAWISLELRGPLAAWHRLRNGNLLAEAEAPTRADLLALQCRCACLLRDFQAAEKLLAQALQLAPDHSWIRVEEAFLRETEDRYDEALEAVQKGLKRVNGSWYRPAVQSAAHLLQLLGRDDEALILLNQAAAELENAPVLAQLFVLQMELHQYDAAAGTLDRFVQLAPLLEKPGADWVGRQRMRLAYLRKDFASAAELARQIDAPWSRKFADQLDAQKQIGRVQLPVQFVRQHHQTCAPATVAALVRFWNKPAEHLALAEAICYDGTPIFLQRQWAENHGWAVREFRLTWETAVQLIDRHVPFALATVGTGQGHMQAVIGYDACEQTLLLRDPWQRSVVEVVSEPFLKHQRSSGPRAMALVPREESDRISDLDLPDAAQYDLFHRLELNLHLHDRATGQCALEQLAERWPEHPITWQARRALATYDSNNAEVLRCLDKLLELYPHDANLQLAKVSAFRGGPRASLLEFLQRACAEKQVDPALLAQYAQELRSDAREYPLAEKLLERSFRRRPVDALSFAILGDIRWAQRRLEEATELYRFAACLEDKREGFFRAWFSAARHLKTTEEALVHLHDRFQRFGARSGQPACTLFWAYEILDQPAKAFALLDQAITLRPEDGELLCFTAEVNARWGRMEKAEQLVKEAEGKCHRLAWLRTGASVAQYRHDRAAALALWQQVLEQEPLDFQAHRAVAHLLAEANGVAATLEYLEKTCRQFPHHFLLHQLWLDWLRTENLPATEPIVRHLLELDPNNAWTLRELALVLGELRQFEEAALHLELALKLEPESPGTYCTRGRVFQLMGNVPEARKAFRKALEISVDTEFAINALVALCVTETERKEALAFIEQQLIRQVVFGDGLLAFRDVAHPVLSPETMLESLRLALKERPDLWHAWSALVEQLLEMGSLDEALQLAREAADRFPLLPRIWLDLARVQKARLNLADEIAALETALQINSGYALAIMQLVEAHERRSQFHEVLAVLQKAVARQPLHAPLRGYLADALWKLNRGDE